MKKIPVIPALTRLFRLFVFLGASHAVFADDLDVIADPLTPPAKCGEAYERLTHADFAAVASKLARLMCAPYPPNWAYEGLGPRTQQPWNETQLRSRDRIDYTLIQLWGYYRANTKPPSRVLDVLLTVAEDPAAGAGRDKALGDIGFFIAPASPSFDSAIKRLSSLARDPKQPLSTRREAVAPLWKFGNPNDWLDLIIDLSDATPDPANLSSAFLNAPNDWNALDSQFSGQEPKKQAEAFLDCTRLGFSQLLTPENRKRYVRHLYSLLEKIDDGHSGAGYQLAIVIGDFLGIKPTQYGGKAPFQPNPNLPKYNGKYELTNAFFQKTVDNARAWWAKHSSDYQDATPKPAI